MPQLAPGERFAIPHVVIQRHAGERGGMAEHLGDDRHPVGFLKLEVAAIRSRLFIWPPPASASR